MTCSTDDRRDEAGFATSSPSAGLTDLPLSDPVRAPPLSANGPGRTAPPLSANAPGRTAPIAWWPRSARRSTPDSPPSRAGTIRRTSSGSIRTYSPRRCEDRHVVSAQEGRRAADPITSRELSSCHRGARPDRTDRPTGAGGLESYIALRSRREFCIIRDGDHLLPHAHSWTCRPGQLLRRTPQGGSGEGRGLAAPSDSEPSVGRGTRRDRRPCCRRVAGGSRVRAGARGGLHRGVVSGTGRCFVAPVHRHPHAPAGGAGRSLAGARIRKRSAAREGTMAAVAGRSTVPARRAARGTSRLRWRHRDR